ncbi:MAG: SDR family NAD(P)-dependent oxidoreductase [Pseudomonadales bacterium]|nr:SDR family NAD(P)-dependent oxidoreductase [Pseudomonadales bacterium]MDP7357290.1 SDR family NAD(P)-dependent oxidoreductase [Pseudomonadales bacterium]MDP7596261.1 SDR family NAD(P)-dependent oxidoreductase [Pseudomonadales bacterium]HJN51001.1 SDR family NAD(P)-dependent oxidoreductase [Pseudomonadales bacterium]
MEVFAGKTAFITGGAQGIGLGIAKACLKEGMRVAIADVKTKQLKVAESILDSPENVLAIELDVRDRDAVKAAADRTEAAFEKVHVVCNNAGIGPGGPVVSVQQENWYRTLDTNLHGVLNGVQVFAPRIERHGEGGHIVNTASITGFAQQGGGVPYGVTKAGIIALTEVLRVELAGNHAKNRWQNMYSAGRDRWGEEGPPESLISASVLCPDAVDTEISAFYTNPEDDEETRQRKIQWLKHMDIELIKPDLVGEQVVNAIRNDELYIFCDGYGSRRLVKTRTQAMLDAFDRQFPE